MQEQVSFWSLMRNHLKDVPVLCNVISCNVPSDACQKKDKAIMLVQPVQKLMCWDVWICITHTHTQAVFGLGMHPSIWWCLQFNEGR